jgi:hypothetical protein
MMTTLDIDDGLLIKAKQLAAEKHATLTSIVEQALRTLFAPEQTHPKQRYMPRRSWKARSTEWVNRGETNRTPKNGRYPLRCGKRGSSSILLPITVSD